ncbi:MAG: hypothetical protein ACXVHS_05865 [Methanobacterium sp.]
MPEHENVDGPKIENFGGHQNSLNFGTPKKILKIFLEVEGNSVS